MPAISVDVAQVATPVDEFTGRAEQPVIVAPFEANSMVPPKRTETEPAFGAAVAVKVTVPSTLIAAPAAVIVTVVSCLLTVCDRVELVLVM